MLKWKIILRAKDMLLLPTDYCNSTQIRYRTAEWC